MANRSWFSCADFARLGLPGMPGTERGMQRRAEAEGWFHPNAEGISWRKRKGRGGGREVHYSRLPPLALMALLIRQGCPPQRTDAPTC